MPPSGSAEDGWRNENECCLNMHPIACLVLETRYAIHATFERVKRISADCSSAECAYRNRTCPRVSHYLLSLPDSSIKLSTELASPRVHLDTTAHHAPNIWLSAQSQMDRWRIELHTVCIPTSVLCVINTRPLSDLMISALPFSLLSTG